MNLEKIKQLADRLRRMRHPEHYQQGYWGEKTACGTAACLGGHTVLMEGYRLKFPHDSLLADYCVKGKGREVDIEAKAEQILDLPHRSAAQLFTACPEERWPTPFNVRWEETRKIEDLTARADARRKIAVDLLDGLVAGTVQLTS